MHPPKAQDSLSSASTPPPAASATMPATAKVITKSNHRPPRPASLDRRRLIQHHSRHERDSKSRSAHSLQEPSQMPENKCMPRGNFRHR